MLLHIVDCPVISLSPDGGNVPVNTTFTCTADAYPAVSLYQWNVSNGTGVVNRSELTLISLGNYDINCTAVNYLYGGTSNPCSTTIKASGVSYSPGLLTLS